MPLRRAPCTQPVTASWRKRREPVSPRRTGRSKVAFHFTVLHENARWCACLARSDHDLGGHLSLMDPQRVLKSSLGRQCPSASKINGRGGHAERLKVSNGRMSANSWCRRGPLEETNTSSGPFKAERPVSALSRRPSSQSAASGFAPHRTLVRLGMKRRQGMDIHHSSGRNR
jgi:hypothetical protein